MRTHALGSLLVLAASAPAAPLAFWDFNTDDGNVDTGTLAPSVGSGSLNTWNTSSTFFTGGSPNDPATFPLDSAWSVGGYPAQGTASNTVGFVSFVSTAGSGAVSLSFDVINQPSANKWFSVNLTTNGGASWQPYATFSIDATNTWETKTVDLSEATGVTDNALFGFQFLAIFKPGTSAYEATEAGYNGDFGAVYDRLAVNARPVPEPATMAALALGIAAMRRRKKA